MKCPRCNGQGKSSAYLGAFTPEQFERDPEFAEDYLRGYYDRLCDMCGGAGRVGDVQIKRWNEHRKDKYIEWLESGCPEGSFDKWSGL